MAKVKAGGTENNDLRVLSPEVVVWKIGEREFKQTPATLDALADIMDVIVDEVLSSGNSNLIDKLMNAANSDVGEDGDEKKKDGSEEGLKSVAQNLASDRELITGLIRIVATLPRAMPRIAAAILGTEEEATEDYLRANLRPKEAFGMLRTFIKQNDVGSIVRDFFALTQEFKTEMAPEASKND